MTEQTLLGPVRTTAIVIGGGVSETQEGKPQAFITLQEENADKTIHVWTGSFNEGTARGITMKALAAAGFTGSLNDLTEGKGFEVNKQVSITIDDNIDSRDGKNYGRRVAWINNVSKAAVLMNAVDALTKMKGMGLDADFAQMFAGGSGTKAPEQKPLNPDDIPF